MQPRTVQNKNNPFRVKLTSKPGLEHQFTSNLLSENSQYQVRENFSRSESTFLSFKL